MNKVRKLENDNKVYVAVLVSPDFGAGWSTWNNNHPEILFDPVVVNHLNPLYGTPYDAEKYNTLTEYLMDKYDSGYFGGLSGLVIEWVQEGLQFVIDEYDGSETLMIKEWIDFITA